MSGPHDRESAHKNGLSTFPFPFLDQNQRDAVVKLQNEFIDEVEIIGRAWFGRVRSEIEICTDLATKLSKSRTLPEGLAAYRGWVSQHVQISFENGQLLFDETQKMIAAFSRAAHTGGKRGAEPN